MQVPSDATSMSGSSMGSMDKGASAADIAEDVGTSALNYAGVPVPAGLFSGESGGIYTGWAGTYAFFFSILIYTTTYLTIVQKAFTLITYLPDKVLRWIGGTPESLGTESAQWAEEGKSKVSEAGKSASDAQAQTDKQLGGFLQKGADKAASSASEKTGGGGSASAEASSSAPEAAATAAEVAT
jgi:defect-in-organelle-trafficking protein DotA